MAKELIDAKPAINKHLECAWVAHLNITVNSVRQILVCVVGVELVRRQYSFCGLEEKENWGCCGSKKKSHCQFWQWFKKQNKSLI